MHTQGPFLIAAEGKRAVHKIPSSPASSTRESGKGGRLGGETLPFAAGCLNSHNADLVAIQVIQTNVGSRIFHTTSVFLIRDMGVDSISGNTKLASGQGNVPVTVAQCLADFDTS